MTAQLQSPWIYLADSDGEPLAGAKVRIYEPGTTTELDVFSDEEATVVVNQPIIADAAGRITRHFVTQKYKMTVHTSADVLVTTIDDQDPGLPSGFGVSATVQIGQGGTGATNAPAARANLGAASNSAVTSLQNTVTEHDTLIETGLHSDGDRFGALAAVDEVEIDNLATGFGAVRIQRVIASTPTNNTVSSSIPADGSIPQIGEGTELFTQAFTPLLSTSLVTVRVEVTGESTGGAGGTVVLALFKNETANAVRASCTTISNLHFGQLNLAYEESPGGTSQITFKARIGTTGTLFRINGSGNTTLGGVIQSRMVIEEWVTA